MRKPTCEVLRVAMHSFSEACVNQGMAPLDPLDCACLRTPWPSSNCAPPGVKSLRSTPQRSAPPSGMHAELQGPTQVQARIRV